MGNQIYLFMGNGSEKTAKLAKNESIKLKVFFHGILNEETKLLPGAYHTSIYDFNFFKLTSIIEKNKIKVFCLGDIEYSDLYDFYQTQNFLAELSLITTVTYLKPDVKNDFIKILFSNKAICTMPWTSTYQSSIFTASCCQQDLVSNYNVEKIKTSMLNNIKPIECRKCYELEDRNAISPRLSYSAEWSQRLNIKNIKDLISYNKIKFFDIRLDNTCNLMCRTCNPQSSNLIEKEYIELKWHDPSCKVQEASIHYTDEQLIEGERFYFAGGEPTWHPDFLKTLDRLDNLNRNDANIIINTNAAKFPKKLISKFKKFTNLVFTISYDGLADKLKYIRWPIKWEEFCHNLKIFQSLTNKPFHFNCVISIYNISSCFEMIKWIEDNYPTSSIDFTILTTPDILQAKYFPDKNLALDQLSKIKTLSYYSANKIFASKIQLMENLIVNQNLDKITLLKFFQFNDMLDKSRQCRLSDYIPELEKCRKYL